MRIPGDRRRRGNSVVEFTLIGIPLIFVLISTFELARGMWLYHTVAYAVKSGSRYASVHGLNCANLPNTCSVTVGQIAQVIRSDGTGLDPASLNLTFTDNTGATVSCSLTACILNTARWPPAYANTPGMNVSISASYAFRSALCMFWPGSSSLGHVPVVNLPASSTEKIKF
jgi:TadE-like protein